MAASKDSIQQLADIIDDLLDIEPDDYDWVCTDLRKVTGNKSLLDTCEALAKELERRHG